MAVSSTQYTTGMMYQTQYRTTASTGWLAAARSIIYDRTTESSVCSVSESGSVLPPSRLRLFQRLSPADIRTCRRLGLRSHERCPTQKHGTVYGVRHLSGRRARHGHTTTDQHLPHRHQRLTHSSTRAATATVGRPSLPCCRQCSQPYRSSAVSTCSLLVH